MGKYGRICTLLGLLSYFYFEPCFAARLQVFVLAPPIEINWSSPKSLLETTVESSTKSSFAVDGHIAVAIEGVSRVLTSMASSNPLQTSAKTLMSGLGLSALFYDFSGQLDTSSKTRDLIEKARASGRLAEIDIPVEDSQVDQMMQFLQDWIRHGSFRHYQGGHIASQGVGAGCADFVMYFMNKALKGRAPLKAWMREVYLPYALTPGKGPNPVKKVSPVKILNEGSAWASSSRDGYFFMIPDPELIYRWVLAKSPTTALVNLSAQDIRDSEIHFSAELIADTPFQSPYALEPESVIQQQWNKIAD